MLDVKHGSSVLSPMRQKTHNDRQISRVILAIPDRLVDGVLDIEDNEGGRGTTGVHARRYLSQQTCTRRPAVSANDCLTLPQLQASFVSDDGCCGTTAGVWVLHAEHARRETRLRGRQVNLQSEWRYD